MYLAKPWGSGARMRERLGVAAPAGTGEAWLVSDVEGQPTRVADGPHAGKTLRELVRDHPRELLGEAGAAAGRFPLLVKLLEVADKLSVQVHPDAATARALGDGTRGKCEAWFVLDAGPAGEVGLGFEPPIGPEELLLLAREGRLAERMRRFRPAAGEGVEIVPGTFHFARDLLFLEVQETSDITYRVWDWGSARELHLRQAAECLRRIPDPRPGRVEPAARTEVATRSPFRFEVGEAPLEADGAFPRVVVCLSGSVEVGASRLAPGEAAVLPASAPRVRVDGTGRVALAGAPDPNRVA